MIQLLVAFLDDQKQINEWWLWCELWLNHKQIVKNSINPWEAYIMLAISLGYSINNIWLIHPMMVVHCFITCSQMWLDTLLYNYAIPKLSSILRSETLKLWNHVDFSTFISSNYFLMILCKILNQIHHRIITHWKFQTYVCSVTSRIMRTINHAQ